MNAKITTKSTMKDIVEVYNETAILLNNPKFKSVKKFTTKRVGIDRVNYLQNIVDSLKPEQSAAEKGISEIDAMLKKIDKPFVPPFAVKTPEVSDTKETMLEALDEIESLGKKDDSEDNSQREWPTEKQLTPIRPKPDTEIQKMYTTRTRVQAMAGNVMLYWNGTPCEKGHVSPRYTSSGECKKCYQMFRAEEIKQSEISKDPLKKEK